MSRSKVTIDKGEKLYLTNMSRIFLQLVDGYHRVCRNGPQAIGLLTAKDPTGEVVFDANILLGFFFHAPTPYVHAKKRVSCAIYCIDFDLQVMKTDGCSICIFTPLYG
ncbi:hypothetical protein TNCT_268961 [Trichonephila clavata]|uniref:Uncharacterized protein n=1 Tax=Trichonephila clavata TaxID=2740835 RepID=A0A8X6HZB3_TRICU|nr:hypothetical protein TNCT_268961 [Trichonephila clavata]